MNLVGWDCLFALKYLKLEYIELIKHVIKNEDYR